MLDQKILIYILLLVLFYFVFSYQENFGGEVDNCYPRLLSLDGRSVKDTDPNYTQVITDCRTVRKNPIIIPTATKQDGIIKIINTVSCR